jgi:hypothetical protein
VKNIRFVGLDVHAETVAVAVADSDGEVRSLGVIPNRPESIRKLVGKLGAARSLRVCYEAGPCGYVCVPVKASARARGLAFGPARQPRRTLSLARHGSGPSRDARSKAPSSE